MPQPLHANSRSGIYRIVHRDSWRAYVGSAVNIRRRWNVHRQVLRRGTHHSSKLQRAWSKYGEDAFDFQVIFYCEPLQLLPLEQSILDICTPAFNCNPNARSWLGRKHSPETRAKLSKMKLGVPTGRTHVTSEETRAKISAARVGQRPNETTLAKLRAARIGKRPAQGMVHSEEVRSRMSASHRQRWARMGQDERTQWLRRQLPNNHGRKHSSESIAKMSASASSRVRSPQSAKTKAKIRAALIASWVTRRALTFKEQAT